MVVGDSENVDASGDERLASEPQKVVLIGYRLKLIGNRVNYLFEVLNPVQGCSFLRPTGMAATDVEGMVNAMLASARQGEPIFVRVLKSSLQEDGKFIGDIKEVRVELSN
ncbi:MAG: hypothetical protein AAGF59_06205 [Pseudomonadota bacterium]